MLLSQWRIDKAQVFILLRYPREFFGTLFVFSFHVLFTVTSDHVHYTVIISAMLFYEPISGWFCVAFSFDDDEVSRCGAVVSRWRAVRPGVESVLVEADLHADVVVRLPVDVYVHVHAQCRITGMYTLVKQLFIKNMHSFWCYYLYYHTREVKRNTLSNISIPLRW